MERDRQQDARLPHVGLISGVGGFPLALRAVSRPVALCEIDIDACRVLRRRFPGVPLWTDIRTLRGHDVPPFELLTAGFPCQDLSVAGRKRGLREGHHSCLLWEVMRLLAEVERPPSYVLLENVPSVVRDL
ncbi:DNA cytosine methyltransferase [bacterium]|nr:DNA cytosine methyltransferase [bacterium]